MVGKARGLGGGDVFPCNPVVDCAYADTHPFSELVVVEVIVVNQVFEPNSSFFVVQNTAKEQYKVLKV